MDVTAFCTRSTVLVVAGKGGVGKTTVSAAVARLAARNGLSVLLVELDRRSGPNAGLDGPSPPANKVERSVAGSGHRPFRSAKISRLTVTPDDVLVEYLNEHRFFRAARHLANSGMLDMVATAIPGIRDILVLGKIVQLERAATADLIVVDGPAAGHATTFLTSARGLLDSSRAGPISALAAEVVEFLSNPARCEVVLVTLAEETPVNETVETALTLEDRVGVVLGPLIVNALYARLDDLDADPEDAAVAAGVTLRADQVDAMRAAAAFRRSRQEMQAEQATRLAEALPLPQLCLPHLFAGGIGLAEIDLLADALESALDHLPEPHGRAGTAGPPARSRVRECATANRASSS